MGQDPYHGCGQAHGLSFSVCPNVPIPPSLRNIFKELQRQFPERAYEFPHGCLLSWHKEEGIFLLNCALTVVSGAPESHIDAWQAFTNAVIDYVQEHNKKCVFLLLGQFAKSKACLIKDAQRVIPGVHPSPRTQGFYGSGVFALVEERLGEAIDWRLWSNDDIV